MDSKDIAGTVVGVLKATQYVHNSLYRCLQEKSDRRWESLHEIRGIVDEEVEELHAAVKANDPGSCRAELVDIAVAALWGIVSIDQAEIKKT